MTIIHPNWQPTDDVHKDIGQRTEDRGNSVRSPKSEVRSPDTQSVSRRPAAILGILLALSIGTVMLRDDRSLSGALTGDAVQIQITATGFVPERATAKAGQKITWKNDATIPHILSSQTLRTNQGQTLQTSPIFPGTTADATLASDLPPGEYPYLSQTDVLAGVIVVEAAASSSSPSSVQLAPSSSSKPIITPPLPGLEPAAGGGLGASVIPRNPHTVGAAGAGITPLPPGSNKVPSIAQGGYKPTHTPETGPALWIVSGVSIAALLIFTRRAFRRIGA